MHSADERAHRRVAGELAQYACSMTGFAFQAASIAEDLSVVIFGERDCVNAFPRLSTFGGAQEWNFYTAALREDDVIGGRAEERLLACLRAVASRGRPILVLSTCVTEMIGADAAPVCAQVEAETGVRVVPVRTSGLNPRTQAEVMDWFAQVLWDSFRMSGDPEPDRINVIGYQTRPPPDPRFVALSFRGELDTVLQGFGLRLNAAVPAGARLHDWAALPLGGLTCVSERALYRRLCDLLDRSGRPVVEVPPPKGVAGTDAFYETVARTAGVSDRARLDSIPERRLAAEALAEGRARFSGVRLAYGLGSHHNFEASQIAFEGLADLPLLQELGFEVTLVIQERDRPEVHERIQRNLAALGVDLHYHLFYEPAVLAPLLKETGAQVAYLSDFLSDQADQAGVSLVRLGRLQSGYRGVPDAVGLFSRALVGGFEARHRRYLRT